MVWYGCPLLGLSGWGLGGIGGYTMVFGMLIGLVFLGLIVWFVIKMFNEKNCCFGEHNREHKSSNSGSNCLDILKERYAKGEINKQEYEILRNEISGMPKAKPLSKMKKELR